MEIRTGDDNDLNLKPLHCNPLLLFMFEQQQFATASIGKVDRLRHCRTSPKREENERKTLLSSINAERAWNDAVFAILTDRFVTYNRCG